jgi:hypothetical protein
MNGREGWQGWWPAEPKHTNSRDLSLPLLAKPPLSAPCCSLSPAPLSCSLSSTYIEHSHLLSLFETARKPAPSLFPAALAHQISALGRFPASRSPSLTIPEPSLALHPSRHPRGDHAHHTRARPRPRPRRLTPVPRDEKSRTVSV